MDPLARTAASLFACACACATTEPPPATTAPALPASVASAASGGAGPAEPYGFDVDPTRRACRADVDCQVVASCDCGRCIPSKTMEVQMCPSVCATNACAQRHPRCAHGLCTTEGHSEAIAAAMPPHLADVTRVVQLVLDAPPVRAYLAPRAPVVAWEPGAPRPRWTLAGKPLAVEDGRPPEDHMLVPTQIWFDGGKASVTFWYMPESKSFHGELVREGGDWVMKSVEASP